MGGTARKLAALAIAGLIAAGCGDSDDAPEETTAGQPTPPSASKEVALEEVAKLNEPIHMAQPPGEDDLLYVAERQGRIRLVSEAGAVAAEAFLDIRREVSTEGEGGFFSLAFPEDHEDSGLLYVAYSGRDSKLHVDEFRSDLADDPRADPSSRREVLAIAHPNSIHWGGQLQTGPDGMLYLSTGDGGPLEPTPPTAQDRDLLLGKLLRIDPRATSGRPYSIPGDNPFVKGSGADEVFALGLRNPWRFSFDRKSGDVAIGDVGYGSQEEVDIVPLRQALGANFGWPFVEGEVPGPVKGGTADATGPVFAYDHATGDAGQAAPVCAITGGYVIRDPALPALAGRYLYTDYCVGELRSFEVQGGGARDDRPLGTPVVPRLASFAEDQEGRLYAISMAGEIFRLVPG